MPSITIKGDKLAAALRAEGERVRAAIPLASLSAARRLGAYIADQIDDKGITDRGILKGSINVERNLAGGATMSIDAPHAGPVELGARPHAVGKAVRELLKRWAMRKLGLSEKEAERAAWGIAHKIETEGQKPTYVVRDSMPKAAEFLGEEMKRILSSARPAA